MSDSFWKKVGNTLLGQDAMKVVDRMAYEKREKVIHNAKKLLEDAAETYSDPHQQAPKTEVERAAYSAMKRLEASKKDGSTINKRELIKAAQAIHKGRQAVLNDLDPKQRQDLENLAKNVFGIKD